ncbi:RpoE-regulated lipoprotein [Leminorella richardii]|uniref:RpoE-regulated lipoprotein n=1 Tax=Leminorella richardii TaxID=158841 RepID=A0A2X4UEE3_9GAMM|nr:RpoE-regulated lipoprotein [Leminorella richardii]SQI37141.1 RpoE-regulated lipoprotein [Leminorella richardii]
MNIRAVLLLACFSLAGCSSVSQFSWSSLSPFSWFGSDLTLSDSGLGEITASTMMDESTLDKALDGDYRLRKGMGIENGQVVSFYEAMDDDDVALIVHGGADNRVARIDVMDKSVKTPKGTQVGTQFADLYSKAFGICQVAEDSSGNVVCRSPESRRISYVFGGKWMGSKSIMPPDDTLKGWTVKKMVWQSQ